MAKKEKGEKKDKVPFSKKFGEWLHHRPTGPDDEDTYCGTRNAEKWRALLFFYFCFYGALIIFWVICYQAMFANIPARIGGSGPPANIIKSFGFIQVYGNSGDYSNINGDTGSYTFAGTAGTEAFSTFRRLLFESDYTNLQTAIGNTVTAAAGTAVSGSQFLYNNCTIGVDGCTAASNYGNFGPVYLVTYRNRKWNRPKEGSTCNMVCNYEATLSAGGTSTGTISADHFWQLDYETGAWINGNANFDCREFQNQPSYRIFTAVSSQGYTSDATKYALTCTVADIEDDSSGGTTVNYVA
mmetsp:Transcript_87531/g.121487  ORF Transcript_87531/g.121487 Transcript_87531/m.121487 type:complete len:298 (+) Transcript_87531:58-951(+)